jgi:hypothetical protein
MVAIYRNAMDIACSLVFKCYSIDYVHSLYKIFLTQR